MRFVVPAVASLLVLQAALAPADDQRSALSWDALGQVGLVKQQDRFVPQFPKEVAALERKEVRLQGFMLPLDTGAMQKRFLLSAVPSTCGFCMPGGPDQLVEVQAKAGVKYVLDPITVSGRLVLVREDPGGLLYRLTDAVTIEK